MTTQVTENHAAYRSAFDQLQRESNGVNPLSELRTRGFSRFAAAGFPTTALESWRFTNVNPLTRRQFVVAGPTSLDPAMISQFELENV